jgi:hypothetical protein
MATIDEPSSGSVVLRSIKIDLNSDIGAAFTVDCCRFIEGLISEEALRKKFELDDAAWQGLSENEELQRLVGAQKEKRIRNGEAAREKAAHLFVEAPTVLGDILRDPTNSPRHRVDAIRELRACAGVGSENKPADEREHIHISINFGTSKVRLDAPMKTIKPEREPLTIEKGDEEYEGEYERERDF